MTEAARPLHGEIRLLKINYHFAHTLIFGHWGDQWQTETVFNSCFLLFPELHFVPTKYKVSQILKDPAAMGKEYGVRILYEGIERPTE